MATDITRPPQDPDVQAAYNTLLIGGIAGALIVLATFISAYYWWSPLISWLRDGTEEKLWQPLVAVAVHFVGLAVMFATFLAARRVERKDASLRRTLYGYNTGLQLWLVAFVLSLIVFGVSVLKPLPFDTTESGFFSLSEKTQRYVSELETPVTVYMLMDPGNPAYGDMKTVLAQMETINPRYFRYEELSTTGSAARARDLAKRFKQFNQRSDGLLVAYGEKPEDNHSYIVEGELANLDFGGRGRSAQRSFNGEARLMQELQFLAEDKKRPVIYLTQGHGEPDMNDRTSPGGLADLVMRLSRANFDVRPLTASSPIAEKNSVPPDADVVMVVGPQRSMTDMVPALRKYMQPADPNAKKGKLVVLLGPTPGDPEKKNAMIDTGLEPLLEEFGVTATKEKLFMFALDQQRVMNDQEFVFVGAPGAMESTHPIAAMFKTSGTLFHDVRRLEPAQQKSQSHEVEQLLVSLGWSWTETDMKKPLGPTVRNIREGVGEAELVNREPRLMLAAISERKPADPHTRGERRGTPRMIVCGCSAIATNRMQRTQTSSLNFDLIRGSIDWCRERSANIGIEPKTYQYYQLPKQTTNWNLFYLPLAAMTLGVLGLGVIVWNIRRS